jgi:hypothetical protein
MKLTLRRLVRVTLTLLALSAATVAQKTSPGGASQAGQQSGQGAPSAPGGGSGAGLQGLSYSPDEWPDLRLPDVKGPAFTYKNGRTVVCYRLALGNSATQPFALVPLTKNEIKGSGFYRPCGDNSEGETDNIGQKTCRKNAEKAARGKKTDTENGKEPIDPTHWSPCSELRNQKDPLLMNQLLVIGIDVSELGETGVNINQLKVLNINVTNQQSGPLNPSPIRPSFPATATSGGGSGQGGSAGGASDTSGEGAWWIPIGHKPPNGSYPRNWHENTPYKAGDVVSDSAGRRFYMTNQSFTSGPNPTDPFPTEPRVERIVDGTVLWQEVNGPAKAQPYLAYFWINHQQPIHKDDLVCIVKGLKSDNTAHFNTVELKSRSRVLLARLGLPEVVQTEGRAEMRDAAGAAKTDPPTCADAEETLNQLHRLTRKTSKSNNSPIDISDLSDALQYLRNASEFQAVGEVGNHIQSLIQSFDDTVQPEQVELATDRTNVDKAQAQLKNIQNDVDAETRQVDTDKKKITADSKSGDADQLKNDQAQLREDTAQLTTARNNLTAAEGALNAAEITFKGDQQNLKGDIDDLLSDVGIALKYVEGQHLQYYRALNDGYSGSVPADPLSIAMVPRAIYLQWPYVLPGDIIPTFNVNLVYTPPTPGTPWEGNTFYPAGSVVTPRVSNGHFYTAVMGGTSGPLTDEPKFPTDSPPNVSDGSLVWLDSGTTMPSVPQGAGAGSSQTTGGGAGGSGGGGGGGGGAGGAGGAATAKAQLWFPNTRYLLGDTILNPNKGHYYSAVNATQGFSGAASAGARDPFSQAVSTAQTLIDGQVQWLLTTKSSCPPWQANTSYSIGQCMLPSNGSYYEMTASSMTTGTSGTRNPFPARPVQDTLQTDVEINWMFAPAGKTSRGWQSNHPYSVGDPVADPNDLNHVFVVASIATGKSGSFDPTFSTVFGQPSTVSDGDLLWADLGMDSGSSTPTKWYANHVYHVGDSVLGSNNHDYRVVHFTAGISGVDSSVFDILQSSTVQDPKTTIKETTGLEWLDLGEIKPLTLKPCEPDLGKPNVWEPNVSYSENCFILVRGVGNGRYYEVLNTQPSGASSPFANMIPPFPIMWADSGTTAPASMASGQPADQTVSLINLALPQSHSLSYFNISAGVAVDFKRPPIFNFVSASSYVNNYHGKLPTGYVPAPGAISIPPASTAYGLDGTTGCTITVPMVTPPPPPAQNPNFAYECPVQTVRGAHPVDPVLVLTLYVPPIDAERPMRLPRFNKGFEGIRDYVPAPSFGLSLSNPTTNFFLGASNELFIRNVQAFYGLALHNVPLTLAPGSSQPIFGGAGTAPTVGTVSKFQKGFFLGVTFNLTGFVQSLFGGGGGAAK